jgi:hypothetical protein
MTRCLPEALSFLAIYLVGCSSDGGDGRGFRGGESGVVPACVATDYPCPDAAGPTYANDVAPILNARCNGCHGNGGQAVSAHDFTSERLVENQSTEIQGQIKDCLMPPPPLAPLSATERYAVMTWLRCVASKPSNKTNTK